MSAIYKSSPLNTIQKRELLSLIDELDIARGIKIEIIPDNTQKVYAYEVTIVSLDKAFNSLLHATFKDGMMQHRGWNKKFVCLQQ